MHLHILGICGTFMGGLAALAREAGHRVTGCDAGVYRPIREAPHVPSIAPNTHLALPQISPDYPPGPACTSNPATPPAPHPFTTAATHRPHGPPLPVSPSTAICSGPIA